MAAAPSSVPPAAGGRNLSVIGVGRLGLCFALALEHKGHSVVGVDVNQTYVDAINAKTARNPEPGVEEYLQKSTRLRATTDMADACAFSDVLFIVVATPSTGGDRHYDHGALSNVLEGMNKLKLANKHIVICCTIMPGYISQVANHLIRDCTNCSVSYNPEFIAQGDIMRGLFYADMVLIGEGCKEAGDVLEGLYTGMQERPPVVSRMSAESAEITKLSVNCFITMKIAYANLVGDICDKTPGADKMAVLKAVGADSRVGSKCIVPGYGFGGPCFPRDNRALATYSASIGVKPILANATDEANAFHTNLQAQDLLAQDLPSYTFEDVAYKPKCPVPIIEESQKLVIAERLVKAGKRVVIRDRPIITGAVRKVYGNVFEYEEVEDTGAAAGPSTGGGHSAPVRSE